MIARWSIRNKLLLGLAMLGLIVAMLAFNGIRGVYAYRGLAKSISQERAKELEFASQLSYRVGELRAIVGRSRRPWGPSSLAATDPLDLQAQREEFRRLMVEIRESLDGYAEQLRTADTDTSERRSRATREREWNTVERIHQRLDAIDGLNRDDDWVFCNVGVVDVDDELSRLHQMTLDLATHLSRRMAQFADAVRGQYRIWIAMSWVSILLSAVMLGVLVQFLLRSVFRPLRTLLHGSRRIAREGDFNHRIQLATRDEIAELAEALNAMTDRFQRIRGDLDRQIRQRDEEVKQRTMEVVRSEKFASVGLLAAGVAHEINNPLAAIAWAAEALEMRLHDVLCEREAEPAEGDGDAADEGCGERDGDANDEDQEFTIIRNYLRDIQDEAFRCKGITDRLLDYSRMGDMEKQAADLQELVQGVIDMVRHLGKYRQKQIVLLSDQTLVAPVNPQEIKQVVLNLITNALDSLDPGGTVTIDLCRREPWAELIVRDNGCGMTKEVKRHLFEPFFTRRRDGQGTGLGLSISYRIIQDHGGEIVATSDGPGSGSEFRVTLPLVAKHEEDRKEQRQVA